MKKLFNIIKWAIFLSLLVTLAFLLITAYLVRGTEMGLWVN